MKHLKYKVIVNTENASQINECKANNEGSEAKEYLFRTMKEVCEFLDISYGSLYSLRSGRLKCKHYSKKHLANIKVEKIEYDRSHYQKKKGIDRSEYINSLDEKYLTC